jgi:predicted porin
MTMKNVSKLALFVAAGMVSAGVQAATIDIREDTTMGIEGEYALSYQTEENVAGDSTDTLSGGFELGIGAVRSFDNFDAYAEITLETSVASDDDSATEAADQVIGLEGDFGQVEFGDSDSVYEDLITDSLDLFEDAGVDDAGVTENNSMLTFYGPSMNGLSFNFQTAIEDDGEGDEGSAEQAIQATIAYDFGAGAVHAGYDDRGLNADSSDETLGIATVFGLGAATEIALKYEAETVSDEDTDYTGLGLAYDYGMGSLYGAVQSVSPDVGSSRTEFAMGVDYSLEDDFKVYGEYQDFDNDANDADDSLMSFGLVYNF